VVQRVPKNCAKRPKSAYKGIPDFGGDHVIQKMAALTKIENILIFYNNIEKNNV